MKEVICYKLDDGSLFEDKQKAIEYEDKLNSRQVLDVRQSVPLKFYLEDIVYVAVRNKVRQCKVTEIENIRAAYNEFEDELYTQVVLQDINDIEEMEFTYNTCTYTRDLNSIIVLDPMNLFNFKYELQNNNSTII